MTVYDRRVPGRHRVKAWQQAVLAWSSGARRSLPWRDTRDPWAVLVSEMMLQQTPVDRVVPRYHSFLARFPDPAACASAPAGDVISAWAGLGYNRRAIYLHRAAGAIVEHHDGRMPSTLASLLHLPGVGPYTARAVLAFAFEQPVGVVDTNAARVLARSVAGRRLGAREAQALADSSVPPGRSWEWNQAMLDLGAGHCTSRPRCGGCPLSSSKAGGCAWAAARHQLPDPAAGSAGVSKPQTAFAGSERQGRGRLVDALRRGPVPLDRVADAAGWPGEPGRAARVAAGLVADGLAVQTGRLLSLP